MAKKRKITAEQAAFDERTKMINEHIERLRRRAAEKKAGEQPKS